MSRRSIILFVAVLALGSALGASVATAVAGPPQPAAPSVRGSVVALDAPGVRAAAFVRADGSYARKKAFRKITEPFPGTYCLQLPRGMSPGRVLPIVAVEYGSSEPSAAQWDSTGDDCAGLAKSVEVETLTGATSTPQPFTIVVP